MFFFILKESLERGKKFEKKFILKSFEKIFPKKNSETVFFGNTLSKTFSKKIFWIFSSKKDAETVFFSGAVFFFPFWRFLKFEILKFFLIFKNVNEKILKFQNVILCVKINIFIEKKIKIWFFVGNFQIVFCWTR